MRHGETLFNKRGKIQGWTDSPLTELGRRQPLYAKRWFEARKIEFDHVYCSTSERASDTLELITEMPYERLKGIKEFIFGIFDGESEALHIGSPPFADEYVRFGGESGEAYIKRINTTLTDIMNRDNHETVLAVAHAGVCGTFTYHWRKHADFWDIKLTNCCIIKFEYEDGTFTFIEAIDHDFDQPLIKGVV